MSKYIDTCLAAIADARATLEGLRSHWDDEVSRVAVDGGIEDINDLAIMLWQRDEELFTVLNEAVAAVPTEELDNYLRSVYAREGDDL